MSALQTFCAGLANGSTKHITPDKQNLGSQLGTVGSGGKCDIIVLVHSSTFHHWACEPTKPHIEKKKKIK